MVAWVVVIQSMFVQSVKKRSFGFCFKFNWGIGGGERGYLKEDA